MSDLALGSLKSPGADLDSGVGSTLSVCFCNLTLDRIYVRLRDAYKGAGGPEFRLPLAIAGGLSLPFAVALYGWAAQAHLPLPFVLFSVGMLGTTLILACLPLMAYVVDAFGVYTASALTAIIVSRCLVGTFLPLATVPLVEKLGYGWGFTVLGAALLILVPVPVLVMKFGLRWRQCSVYTRDPLPGLNGISNGSA